jgi:hypothetical protein
MGFAVVSIKNKRSCREDGKMDRSENSRAEVELF